MAKRRTRTRRRGSGEAPLGAATGATVGFFEAAYAQKILEALPSGFKTWEEGLGKPATSNTRVMLIAGATLFTVLSKNKKIRRWAPFTGFLLGSALRQHRLTYETYDRDTETLDLETILDETIEQRSE